MIFDLVDLRLFIAVVESGSMASAARRANISVSALHARVKALEIRAGIPLFERTARGSRATKAGMALVSQARAVMLHAERMNGALDAWKTRERGSVTMRANSSALASAFPEILAYFLARHPDVAVHLGEDTSDRIVQAVRTGDADVGIAVESVNLEGLKTIRFLSDRLVLLVPPGHKLADTPSVRFETITDEGFVSLDERSAIHTYLENQAGILGRKLTVRIRLRGFSGVCRMVAAGAGVAVIPSAAIPTEALDNGAKVVAIENEWSQRNLVVCLPLDRPVSGLVQRLVDSLTAPDKPLRKERPY